MAVLGNLQEILNLGDIGRYVLQYYQNIKVKEKALRSSD